MVDISTTNMIQTRFSFLTALFVDDESLCIIMDIYIEKCCFISFGDKCTCSMLKVKAIDIYVNHDSMVCHITLFNVEFMKATIHLIMMQAAS